MYPLNFVIMNDNNKFLTPDGKWSEFESHSIKFSNIKSTVDYINENSINGFPMKIVLRPLKESKLHDFISVLMENKIFLDKIEKYALKNESNEDIVRFNKFYLVINNNSVNFSDSYNLYDNFSDIPNKNDVEITLCDDFKVSKAYISMIYENCKTKFKDDWIAFRTSLS